MFKGVDVCVKVCVVRFADYISYFIMGRRVGGGGAKPCILHFFSYKSSQFVPQNHGTHNILYFLLDPTAVAKSKILAMTRIQCYQNKCSALEISLKLVIMVLAHLSRRLTK